MKRSMKMEHELERSENLEIIDTGIDLEDPDGLALACCLGAYSPLFW